MHITQEHLKGLQDVCNLIQHILHGSFSQDGDINPEPLDITMQKQIAHIEQMIAYYPNDDLSLFTDVAILGKQFITSKDQN